MHCILYLHSCHYSWKATRKTIILACAVSVLPNMTLHQAACYTLLKCCLLDTSSCSWGQGSGGLLPASASSWTCQDIQNLDDDTPNPNLYMLSKFNYSFISSTYNLKVQLILQKKTSPNEVPSSPPPTNIHASLKS